MRHTGQCDSLSVPKPWRSNWPCTQSLGLQQREVPAQTASLEVTATEATEGLVYNAHTTRRDIVIIPTLSRFGRCSDPGMALTSDYFSDRARVTDQRLSPRVPGKNAQPR